jgi:hypothetical protein
MKLKKEWGKENNEALQKMTAFWDFAPCSLVEVD